MLAALGDAAKSPRPLLLRDRDDVGGDDSVVVVAAAAELALPPRDSVVLGAIFGAEQVEVIAVPAAGARLHAVAVADISTPPIL